MEPLAENAPEHHLLDSLWSALRGAVPPPVELVGPPAPLPSALRVAEFATATVASAAAAIAEYASEVHGAGVHGVTHRAHAAEAFRPFRHLKRLDGDGALPSVWDPVAGDYAAQDGYIRLHTNYAPHRAAAMAVLGTPEDRAAVTKAVAKWEAEALESAIVAAGGCAAVMRSAQAWAAHPQGQAVRRKPLLRWEMAKAATARPAVRAGAGGRLSGLRVLDLTRVLAGPTCTGVLAAHGASVLRLDAPDFQEGLPLIAHTTRGKRCAHLDLKSIQGRVRFDALVRESDVLVHGLRPGALRDLGYGPERLSALNPSLVIASLSAYGTVGPWSSRRGFDSLVQMSTGIAHLGMRRAGGDAPFPLPVQALDFGAGFLLAAAVVRGLTMQRQGLGTATVSTSLARLADCLLDAGDDGDVHAHETSPERAEAFVGETHGTLGRFRQLSCPVVVAGAPQVTLTPPRALGTDAAHFG